MWHGVCVDTASQCRRTSNLYVVWRKLGCSTVLTDACMSYVNDYRRHLSMTMLGISVCCLCAICVQTRSFEVSNM